MNQMKKIMMSLAVILLCLLAVPTEKANAAAKLSQTKATVYVGNQVKLKVKGTNKKVVWKTDNKKIATVKNGTVTGKKKGQTVITAKVGNKKYTCKLTVKEQSLNKTKVTVSAGSSVKLKVNGAYKKVTYTTSDKKVATVSKSGNVTAVATGTATITAKHNGKKYTCKVTVKAPSDTIVIKVDKTIIEDKETESATNAYLKQLEIKSKKSDKNFVYYTVTQDSYTKLMKNIKKQLDKDIAQLTKSQDLIKKVTYNSKCTVLNLYLNVENADGQWSDEVIDNITGIVMDVLYYQAFSGTAADKMKLTYNFYDYKTGIFLSTYSI